MLSQGHGSLGLVEAAAKLKLRASWGQERVCRSWLVALRLTELPLRRPGGGLDIEPVSEAERLLQMAQPAGEPPSEDAPCSVCGLRGALGALPPRAQRPASPYLSKSLTVDSDTDTDTSTAPPSLAAPSP